MSASEPRIARLVLVDGDGRLLGELPAFAVEPVWWQEVGGVVAGARERYGIDITILRLLSAEQPRPPGGTVTYLAQWDRAGGERPEHIVPLDGDRQPALAPDPRRASYAEVGGPAEDLTWARRVLAARGTEVRSAQQIRTWNLSSIWRLELVNGDSAWLKVVPEFMVAEGALLARLTPAPVAGVIACEGRRTLLAQVPGEDLYDADLDQRLAMVRELVALQARWATRIDELLACGLNDARTVPLVAAVTNVITRVATAADEHHQLLAFAASLEERLQRIAACGLPDTLVHGDFHAGNVRGASRSAGAEGAPATDLVLVDFADAAVGHPLFDAWVLINTSPESMHESIADAFAAGWRAHYPQSEPERALALLEPVSHARQAAIYQQMLDRIEPSEWPYHAADPLACLRRTAAVLLE